MATKEISRSFDHAAGAVIVKLVDDFGVELVATLYVEVDACPACQGKMPVDRSGQMDLETHVAQIKAERNARTRRLVGVFEKMGGDVSEVKLRMAN